jgi:hypothetical protein
METRLIMLSLARVFRYVRGCDEEGFRGISQS